MSAAKTSLWGIVGSNPNINICQQQTKSNDIEMHTGDEIWSLTKKPRLALMIADAVKHIFPSQFNFIYNFRFHWRRKATVSERNQNLFPKSFTFIPMVA